MIQNKSVSVTNEIKPFNPSSSANLRHFFNNYLQTLQNDVQESLCRAGYSEIALVCGSLLTVRTGSDKSNQENT